MKLNEIKMLEDTHPGFFTDRDDVIAFVHTLTNVNRYQEITVNPDSSVDFKGAIEASRGVPGFIPNSRDKLKYILVNFNSTTGDFRVWDNDLRSLKGCPKHVGGNLCLSNNPNLTDIDYMPATVASVEMDSIGAFNNSLIGIEHLFRNTTFSYALRMNFQAIREGGIELINIKGLKKLNQGDRVGDLNGNNRTLPEPFQIIEKYLRKPDDMFECQAELIDNGFEEYAKL